MELDNVWMLHSLQHFQLVVDHLLVSAHILLQDNFDSNLALGAVRFPDDTVGPCSQCLSKAVSRSARRVLSMGVILVGQWDTDLRS